MLSGQHAWPNIRTPKENALAVQWPLPGSEIGLPPSLRVFLVPPIAPFLFPFSLYSRAILRMHSISCVIPIVHLQPDPFGIVKEK